MSVCLPVCLSAVCVTTMYARRTNFRDDLDLDELANDLPSDFLHKLCKFGGGMIKTDIVLHPYLLISLQNLYFSL